jgi:hypothetical protein
MSYANDNSLPVVECRPNKSAWVGVVLFGLMGLFFLIGPILALEEPTSRPPSILEVIGIIVLLGTLGSVMLLGAIWEALWLWRGVIVADHTGLRWRDVRKSYFATWPQVRDYYDETVRRRSATVETEAGNLNISDNAMTNIGALREAISARANNAKTREWGILGARETEWPRTFGYKLAEQISVCRFFNAIAVIWFFGFLWGFVKSWQGWRELWEYSSPALVVLAAVLYLVLMLLYPFAAWMSWLTVREVRSRQTQQITVSQSGLIFEDGARRIECAWGEITDYYRDPMLAAHSSDDRYVVVSTRGSFDFTLLQGRRLLCEIIKRNARNALYQNWRDYRPQHETGAKGERMYNYRTRYNRALMLMPMSVFPISLVVLLVALQPELQPSNPPNFWGLGIVLGCSSIGAAVLYAAYFLGSIEITADGITQRGLRGRKFLKWTEITQLRGTKIGGYELVGRDTRLGFYSMIADVKILRDEIERRAVNAKNAPSWTKDKPD